MSKKTPYIYLTPWLIGLVVFKIYPMIETIVYSFTDYSLMNNPQFVGLENYTTLFQNPKFMISLTATLKYVILTVPFALMFGLFIAFILNFKIKGVGLFRTVYYIPSLLGGSVAVAVLWQTLFLYDGPINNFLQVFGVEPIGWFSDPNAAIISLSLLRLWQFGSMMLIFLAALQGVPEELYEAAQIEGASKLYIFKRVTIPIISPVILFNGVMALIGAFQEFTAPFIITNGGPEYHTYFLNMYIYEEAFTYYNFGYACALSLILVLIILAVTVVVFALSKNNVFYSD
ncbi:MAG: carbohydrate ABC transporter permease [Coprobacillaceae bacterium]